MKRVLLPVFFFIFSATYSQKIKTKTVVRNDSTRFTIRIYPALYDSSLTDQQVMNGVDTLPLRFPFGKYYFTLFKDDTTKFAQSVLKFRGFGLLKGKYNFATYYKNGNFTCVSVYNREKVLDGGYAEYFENSLPKVTGRYHNGKKRGRWRYYDEDGKLLKIETYKRTGEMTEKKFDKPSKNLTTGNWPQRPDGRPYVIR
ncbi:MAG: hypothetical protein HY064_02330 [Bacteroidetes bacterium]|nr:hypothetical protein [Bacteroidota bacterium]